MKRSLPAIVAGVLAVVAVVLALVANRVITGLVSLPDGAAPREVAVADAGAEERPTVRPTAPRAPSKSQYIKGILDRNIFDAEAIGQTSVSVDSGSDTVTDLNLTLIGTVVAKPEQYSSALIAPDNGKAAGYGIGDRIMDAEVVAIEPERVQLKRASGELEWLYMDKAPERPTSTAAASTDDGDDNGIDQLGDNSFAVDREVVEKYLGDLDGLARLGRAIPHRGADGEIDGYRLSGIRRRTIGEQLGIKNGDIVHAVNGYPLTSMQGAMSAYTSLQSESGFKFEITRRGQQMTLEYEVR